MCFSPLPSFQGILPPLIPMRDVVFMAVFNGAEQLDEVVMRLVLVNAQPAASVLGLAPLGHELDHVAAWEGQRGRGGGRLRQEESGEMLQVVRSMQPGSQAASPAWPSPRRMAQTHGHAWWRACSPGTYSITRPRCVFDSTTSSALTMFMWPCPRSAWILISLLMTARAALGIGRLMSLMATSSPVSLTLSSHVSPSPPLPSSLTTSWVAASPKSGVEGFLLVEA